MFRTVNRLGGRTGGSKLHGDAMANVLNETLTGGGAQLPEDRVGNTANVLLQVLRRPQPAVLSTCLHPEIIGRLRVPARHVDSIGHVSDRYFVLWPVRKERLEDVPAHLPVQATHAVDRPAPADRQIGHVETFRRVVWVLAAQGQQIADSNAKLFLGVPTEVLLDESRSEAVKAGSHRSVRGEEITRARDGQRDFKGLRGLLHETPGALQHGKCRMPFI